nr:hypothetical protein VCHA53O474_30042 [Vibrio chagasii]
MKLDLTHNLTSFHIETDFQHEDSKQVYTKKQGYGILYLPLD